MVNINLSMTKPDDLQTITTQVRTLARSREGDLLSLLELLRLLESLHREIQENSFQAALPDNRQALYALLRDIDANGGWPYINRMRLRDITRRLTDAETASDSKTNEAESSSLKASS